MGASPSSIATIGSLHANQQSKQSSNTNLREPANNLSNVATPPQKVKVNRHNNPSKPRHTPSQQSEVITPHKDPSEPCGILHLAIERRVAPIQGHDGGTIMVLHKVGVLATLVFVDGENQDQVDKLRAALGVLHSKDAQVYVVHDYNARGIPGTRKVQLLFATKSVLQSSLDV
jgi:hypothetical protein